MQFTVYLANNDSSNHSGTSLARFFSTEMLHPSSKMSLTRSMATVWFSVAFGTATINKTHKNR